jgi:WD40 repeat protein
MDSGEEKCVRLWDLTTGKQLLAWDGHPDGVHSLEFSSDGKTLLSAGDKGVLRWKMPRAKRNGH